MKESSNLVILLRLVTFHLALRVEVLGLSQRHVTGWTRYQWSADLDPQSHHLLNPLKNLLDHSDLDPVALLHSETEVGEAEHPEGCSREELDSTTYCCTYSWQRGSLYLDYQYDLNLTTLYFIDSLISLNQA